RTDHKSDDDEESEIRIAEENEDRCEASENCSQSREGIEKGRSKERSQTLGWPRGQQKSDYSRTPAPERRRHASGDRQGDRLAESQHSGLHQRNDNEEDGPGSRIGEERSRRADVSDQRVALAIIGS